MQTLVLGTRNRKKRDELVELLSLPQLEVATLDEFPPVDDVVEDGITFLENATKKAGQVACELNEWVLGEDSGLCVDALGGRPGVFSARYSGALATDASNNEKLLRELASVEDNRRTAHYVCVVVLADPEGNVQAVSEGQCAGRIAQTLRGTNGFGYDPLFIFGDGNRTFGELPPEFKRTVSHRANAIRVLRPQLARLMAAQ